LSTLADLAAAFGDERRAALVREISKRFENVITGSIGALKNRVGSDSDLCRGELVIVVEGAGEKPIDCFVDPRQLVKILTEYLPPRVASEAAARLTGRRKNELYRLASTNFVSSKP
jgi:16S rRNA (cytidine1402-2'-O)-methyltransferase